MLRANFMMMMMLMMLVGVLTALPSEKYSTCNCVCGVRGRNQKIVGGTETLPNEYPWVVGLFRQNKLYCGATILTNRYVLTAAHCVSSFLPNEIRVFIGGHNISKDYTEIKRIRKIIPHEKFDIFTFNNDIAVLELETPIFYSNKASPACLPDGSQKDFTNQLTLVSGWGRLSEKSPTSKSLRAVVVPVWAQHECLKAGYGSSRITSNMMCGGYQEGEHDSCQGDSGGAMMAEGTTGSMEVVGIVSWGRGCARKSLPGIYTRVVNYLDWIKGKLDGECLCQPRNGQKTNFLEKIMQKQNSS